MADMRQAKMGVVKNHIVKPGAHNTGGQANEDDVRHVVRGSVHGFLSFPTLKGAQNEAFDVAAGWILGKR